MSLPLTRGWLTGASMMLLRWKPLPSRDMSCRLSERQVGDRWGRLFGEAEGSEGSESALRPS